jgi:hypothetical protein
MATKSSSTSMTRRSCKYACVAPAVDLWDNNRVFISILRRTLYEKRISQDVNGEDLGEEFAGYVRYAVD